MRVKDEVEAILQEVPSARNSDRVLFIEYMQRNGMNLSLSQREQFWNLAMPETVRRIRQKLQEGGKYMATDKVRRERQHKGWIVQQNIPSVSPKDVQRILEQPAIPWLDD